LDRGQFDVTDVRLENRAFEAHIAAMKTRPYILLFAAVFAAAVLLIFRGDLHARNPRQLNRLAEPTTECGFWGSMADGMSCR
jgi:hypothetical protein